MKDLFIGALAVAAGIYAEKKYNVCDKIAEQVKKFTGNDLFGNENHQPMSEDDILM